MLNLKKNLTKKLHRLGGVFYNSAPCYFPAFAVCSPLLGLTSVFGMRTGVSPAPWAPKKGFALQLATNS